MKTVIMMSTLLFCVLLTRSQSIMKMEDNLSVTFNLQEITVLNFNEVNYFNPSITGPGEYYAKLSFGKRKFDIQYYRSDGKPIGGLYPIFTKSEYFRLSDKSEYHEEYLLTRNVGSKLESYKVNFNSLNGFVQVDFSESYNNGKTFKTIYAGGGKF